MNRDGLIRALRKYARRHGLSIVVDKKKGNGSHYRVRLGSLIMTVQTDLIPGRVERILKQLGVNPADL